MGPRILVITPTYNERENVDKFVHGVHSICPAGDILIIDDSSPDGTGHVADEIATRNRHVFVMHREAKKGIGSAYIDGFRWGIERGYDVLFEMDSDLSHDPTYIPIFLDSIERGADLVVGSRNLQGGGVRGWSFGRQWLSKGGNAYSRWVLGTEIHDFTSGFKAFRRQALESIDWSRIESDGYAFQIEITYRVARAGKRVVEVPIVFVDRRAGKSKMTDKAFLQAISNVWKLRLEPQKTPARTKPSADASTGEDASANKNG